ncbi:MAG: pyridoxamine 5'-phosphate oxidase family protein, partial [Actinomycetes bacterium]
MSTEIGGASPRSRLRRLPELGSYDADEIYPILDATTLCHLATIVDGQPMVLPSLHVRAGRTLLVHGSRSSRILRSMTEAPSVCVSVTIVDGLIVARSTFNSSMAYRSVSVFGPARLLDGEEKEAALEKLINGIIPGRSSEVRPSSESEISRTSVLEVTIEEASAKISVGPPDDDDEDV